MSDTLTELTALAVSVYRQSTARPPPEPPFPNFFVHSDPVIEEAQRLSFQIPYDMPQLESFVRTAFENSELSAIASREGELDPMLLHPGGGVRVSPAAIVFGIFASAAAASSP